MKYWKLKGFEFSEANPHRTLQMMETRVREKSEALYKLVSGG